MREVLTTETFLQEQEIRLRISYFREKLQARCQEQEKQELTGIEVNKLGYIKYLVEHGMLQA